MKIVSFNELIELNKIITQKALGYKLHLRDSCGGQSFWIENLDSPPSDVNNELFYSELEGYFNKKNMSLEYFENKMSFRIL